LKPVIDSSYPFAEAAKADDHLDTGQQFGRVILVNDGTA